MQSLAGPAARAAGPATPDAGTILQQVQPVTPPSPLSTQTGLTIEQKGTPKPPPSPAFLVKTIRITGTLRPEDLSPEAEEALLKAFRDWRRS